MMLWIFWIWFYWWHLEDEKGEIIVPESIKKKNNVLVINFISEDVVWWRQQICSYDTLKTVLKPSNFIWSVVSSDHVSPDKKLIDNKSRNVDFIAYFLGYESNTSTLNNVNLGNPPRSE